MPKKTRKASKKRVSTIPELKRSFDHLDTETRKIIAAPGTQGEKVKRLQKVWMNIFHKSLTKDAAESYLAIKKRSKGTRRATRRQRGGMAPLDYTLRAGIDGPHGNFPAYVQSGFGVGYPMPGVKESCGVTDSGPHISASLGSNQVGGAPGTGPGALMNLATAFGGYGVLPSIPPSAVQDFQSTLRGQPIGPSSDPVTNKPNYM